MHPDVAWAAGFYEGEGSITFTAGLQLVVVQVNPDPLYRFRSVFHAGAVGPANTHGLRTSARA